MKKNPSIMPFLNLWADYFLNRKVDLFIPILSEADLLSKKEFECGMCVVVKNTGKGRPVLEYVKDAIEDHNNFYRKYRYPYKLQVDTDEGEFWFSSRANRVNFLLFLAAENGEL